MCLAPEWPLNNKGTRFDTIWFNKGTQKKMGKRVLLRNHSTMEITEASGLVLLSPSGLY